SSGWSAPISNAAKGRTRPSSTPIGGSDLRRSRRHSTRRKPAPMRLDPDVSRGARPLDRIEALRLTYVGARALDVLAGVHAAFPGQVALISSFGADAAVLLHMAATVDPAFPVLMLETGMLFPETLAYQRTLADRLGLGDV